MTVAIARHILKTAGLRRCEHAEGVYCGCPEGRCDERAERLRKFIRAGGWSDSPKVRAWAEEMAEAGYLILYLALGVRYPAHYELTTKGYRLTGPVRRW